VARSSNGVAAAAKPQKAISKNSSDDISAEKRGGSSWRSQLTYHRGQRRMAISVIHGENNGGISASSAAYGG